MLKDGSRNVRRKWRCDIGGRQATALQKKMIEALCGGNGIVASGAASRSPADER